MLETSHLSLLKEDGPVNIFMLDLDPYAAARAHCDRHVVKMILETAQLLSTAWHVLDNEAYWPIDEVADGSPWIRRETFPAARGEAALTRLRTPTPPGGDRDGQWLLHGQRIYNKTHERHPCSVWAREYGGNYAWLWTLGMALLQEYTYRYGKTHACAPILAALEPIPYSIADSRATWTESPPVMPEECRVEVGGFYDTVASYRRYYLERKQPLLQWTRRGAPKWV